MTGHLVFSTIHTNDAASALERLIQMGLPPFMVANTMKVRARPSGFRGGLCKTCKEEGTITAEEHAVFKEFKVNVARAAKLFRPVGCPECKDIGYKGRVGMHELLVLTEAIREQLLKDSSAISSPLREQPRVWSEASGPSRSPSGIGACVSACHVLMGNGGGVLQQLLADRLGQHQQLVHADAAL